MPSGKSWSDREIDILKESWLSCGKPEVMKRLPGRSYGAIKCKASYFNLQKCWPWTIEEDEILREIYPHGGLSAVVGMLVGRTRRAIKTRCGTLSLYRPETEISPLEAEKIIGLYKEGRSTRKVAEEIGKHHASVYTVLLKYGCETRDVRQYLLKEDFLDNIDSEIKSYFLGWMYADGNVYGSTAQLKIADLDILQLFGSFLYDGEPIIVEKKKGKKHHKQAYSLQMNSQKLCKQLTSLGCGPAKTFKIRFPKWLPYSLLPSFFRGYFEGDGWICISKPGKLHLSLEWAFMSNPHFIEEAKNFLSKELGISTCSRKRWKSAVFYSGDRHAIASLTDYVYGIKPAFVLQRKYEKCLLAKRLATDKQFRIEWKTFLN